MLNVRGSSTNLQVLKSWAGLRKQMGLTTFWKQEHVCLSEKFVGLDFPKETICGPTVCWALGAMIHLGYQHLSSQQACLAGVLMTFFYRWTNSGSERLITSSVYIHNERVVGLKWNRLDLKSLLFSLHQKLDTLCDMVSGLFHGIRVFLMCLVLRLRFRSPILF